MSIRKLFHANGGFGRLTGGDNAIRRRARGRDNNVLPACVELLEARTLLSAVITGLDDHGLKITDDASSDRDITSKQVISITAADDAYLSDNSAGSGLYINLDGSDGDLSALQSITITGATVQNNANAGAQIILANMTLDSLIIDKSVFTNNGTNGDGSGLYIELTNVHINNLEIIDSSNTPDRATTNSGDSSFNNNQFDGVTVVTKTADPNPLDGVEPPPTSIDQFVLGGSVLKQNQRRGASLQFDHTTVNTFVLNDNEATDNTNSGVALDTNRTDIGVDSGRIVNNTLNNNAVDGLSILGESVNKDSEPVELSQIQIGEFNDNVANNNVEAGVNVVLRQQVMMTGTLLRNEFNNNGRRGFNITATDVVDPDSGDSLNSFDLQFGTLERDPFGDYVDGNAFDGNTGAGLAIELTDLSGGVDPLSNTKATFRAYGNTITNTADGSVSPLYTGDGINVRLTGGTTSSNGAARMAGVIIDGNQINGNDGDGIVFNVTEDSELADLTIGNLTGDNQSFDVNEAARAGGNNVPTVEGDGNVIENNGGNGISIIRRDSSWVHDVKIDDNTLSNNENGIYVLAANTHVPVSTVPASFPPTLVTEVTMNRNSILNNAANGVSFRTEINAVILADMRYNRIQGNSQQGILSTAVENVPTDFENIGGTWIKNAITHNGQNGIKVEAVTGTVNPLLIGRDGIDEIDEQSLGNFIAFNGVDGIDIQNQGSRGGTTSPTDPINDVSIVNNQIISNGQNALDGSPDPYTAGKGIDIEAHGKTRRFTILRNIIEGNVGDGLEILQQTGTMGVIAQGNTIQSNGGRGLDLLVKGSGIVGVASYFVFGGEETDDSSTPNINEDASNQVLNNGLEGVYVVATAAGSQTQDVTAETALAVEGGDSDESRINLVLDINDNQIRGNGNGVQALNTPPSTFAGTGLVVRVGSNNSSNSYTAIPDDTGTVGPFGNVAAASVGTNSSGFGNGRTNLRVTNNEFSGNAGDDVILGAYVSSTPLTTSGNWDKDAKPPWAVYNVDRDPLARLNVTFTGNTGESLDVLRGEGSNDFAEDSAYRNDESTFKRRVANGTSAPNPDGRFGSGTWPRLATRLGILSPEILGHTFYYDGLGASTLRVHHSGNNFQSATTDFFSARGITNAGRLIAWDTVAANTFSFVTASIGDVTVNEAAGTATVEVTLSDDVPDGGLSISWATADGRAKAGSDYTSESGTLTFAAGDPRTKTITIPIDSDATPEGPESFYVDLTNWSSNTVAVHRRGVVTITEPAKISIGDGQIVEGDDGQKQMAFQVEIQGGGAHPVSVDYATVPLPAGADAATADTDYVSETGTILFNEGQTSKTIYVDIPGDIDPEDTEKFNVVLSNVQTTGPAGSAVIDDDTGIGSIIDNDDVTITVDPATIHETDGTQTMHFTVHLSKAVNAPVTVQYYTTNQSATAGADYVGVPQGTPQTVSIAAGETTGTIDIPVLGDQDQESTETFLVTLTNPSGDNSLGNDPTAVGTIIDDDTPKVFINDAQIVERDGGHQDLVFTISLQGDVTNPVQVHYQTGGVTATVTDDFDSTSGNVTLTATQRTQEIHVPIAGDTEPESDETFNVQISKVDSSDTSFQIGDDTGVGTIIDNDNPLITISDETITETDGNQTMTFTVTTDKAVSEDVTVDYATSVDFTPGAGVVKAQPNLDFQPVSGTATIAAGETSTTFTVTIVGDQDFEDTETFHVDLSNPTNGVLGPDPFGVGTIIDDDTPKVVVSDASLVEGDDGTQLMKFTISLEGDPIIDPVTVSYQTNDGSASVADGDYDALSGVWTFNPGESTSKTVFVTIHGDLKPEPDETFTLDITDVESVSTVELGDPQGTGTIVSDNPLITISDATINETDSGTGEMLFTFSLSKAVTKDVTVEYSTADQTATAGQDYVASSGTVTILAGQTSATLGVTINPDQLVEGTETFEVDLSNPTNGVLGDDTTGVGTIVDDDIPTLSVSDASIVERDTGQQDMEFTISLTGDITAPVTVTYDTIGGTATENTDFDGTTGQVTFQPGDTSKTVRVPIFGDTLPEGSEIDPGVFAEQFQLKITNVDSDNQVLVQDGTGVGSIIDDDRLKFSITDGRITESDSDRTMTFIVTLSKPVGEEVTINYATADGTGVNKAVAGQDYTSESGTLTFAAGDTNAVISVPILGDNELETTENFVINLSDPSAGQIDDGQGVGTIIDDDLPTIRINDVQVEEGDSGAKDMVFTVTLTGDTTDPVTVDWQTVAGTATAGVDFTSESGTFTIPAGESTYQVHVPITGDTDFEGDETFTLKLTSVESAGTIRVADDSGLGTILDDDTPRIAISDASVIEGDGTKTITFDVTLSQEVAQTVTVDYYTMDQSATAGADYVGISQASPGTVTFDPGETTATISITVDGDNLQEGTETFNVFLANPVNAELNDGGSADAVAVGTIIDDDTNSVAISDAEIVEGDGGSHDMVFTITLLGDGITQPVTVDYQTIGGTATEGTDYNPTEGSVTFAVGETTKEVRVPIFGDLDPETDEQFQVRLTSVTHLDSSDIRDAIGIGTIVNDDTPEITIDDATITETDGGQSLSFDVTLSGAISDDVTVHYSTAQMAGLNAATAGDDYDTKSGTLTIAAGETTGTITIGINGDQLFEEAETFQVNLSDPTNATIADDQAIGTILDDDTPTVSVGDAEIVEGDDGVKNMAFTITLSGDISDDVTVSYATADGTATLANNDYESVAGSVTFDFASGETTKTIEVPINGDTNLEEDETFTLNLTDATSPASGTIRIGDASGEGTITDDDRPKVTIDDAQVTETDGTTTITFDVTLSEAIGDPVTINYETAENDPVSATAGTDYQGATGTVTFAPGVTTQTITVTVDGDNLQEGPETFLVNLIGGTNVDLDDASSDASAVGTIIDDDKTTISISDGTMTEGDSVSEEEPGTKPMEFTITRTGDGTAPITVTYETAGDTATAGEDFEATTNSITLESGVTSKTITIPIINDLDLEDEETFSVNIIDVASSADVTVTDDTGTGTIVDNDTPTITISDATVAEGDNTNFVYAYFYVTLSKGISETVTVDYTTRAGTATGSGIDFESESGTLTFDPGQTFQSIFVPIESQDLSEGVEDFFVDLSNPVNATIDDATARGVIVDGDTAVGLVAAPQAGAPSIIKVYNAQATDVNLAFYAYPRIYTGGVNVALGDVNNDGIVDIITSPASPAMFGPLVRVFDGISGSLMKQFHAFGTTSDSLVVDVAAGDVNGDGASDIIVGIANSIAGVRVYDGTNISHVISNFRPYGGYRGGVNIAAGDVTGDGRAEIITVPNGPAPGVVRVFNGATGGRIGQFAAQPRSITTYDYDLAVGDVNGDGMGDIIVSQTNGPPTVQVFNGQTYQRISQFSAYTSRFRGGVNVTASDIDLDGDAEIITAPHSDVVSVVRAFDEAGNPLRSFFPIPRPFSNNFRGGAEIAGRVYAAAFLHLDGQPIADSDAPDLRQGQAETLARAAIQEFAEAGASQAAIEQLASTNVRVADLAGSLLGMERDGTIVLDVNAAGHGWFVDPTPRENEEFRRDDQGQWGALANVAKGKVDLLTVIAHELAHELGFDDVDGQEYEHALMTSSLQPGTRKATQESIEELFGDPNLMDELLMT